MIEKAEMLHRLHALVDRVRLSSAVCGHGLAVELETLEAEQARLDAALAAIIDTYQDGLYRRHNAPPLTTDCHGVSVARKHNRAFVKRLALEHQRQANEALTRRVRTEAA